MLAFATIIQHRTGGPSQYYKAEGKIEHIYTHKGKK